MVPVCLCRTITGPGRCDLLPRRPVPRRTYPTRRRCGRTLRMRAQRHRDPSNPRFRREKTARVRTRAPPTTCTPTAAAVPRGPTPPSIPPLPARLLYPLCLFLLLPPSLIPFPVSPLHALTHQAYEALLFSPFLAPFWYLMCVVGLSRSLWGIERWTDGGRVGEPRRRSSKKLAPCCGSWRASFLIFV